MARTFAAAIDVLRDHVNYREIRFLIAMQYARVPLLRRWLACYSGTVPTEEICDRVRADSEFTESLPVTDHERAFFAEHGYADVLAPPGDHIELRARELVCELVDCEILAMTKMILHRPSERIVLSRQLAFGRNNIRPVIYRRTVAVPGLSISLLPASHYFHFFFNILKPLTRVLRRWPDLQQATLIVGNALAKHQEAALEVLARAYPGLKVESVAPDMRVRCERLLRFHYSRGRLIDYVTDGESLRGLRDMFHGWAGVGDVTPTRRLYISRELQKHRRTLNERALLEALRHYGFEKVLPETLPMREQVRLFASAEAVIGTHGAGLTNLLFCRPGAAVIELGSSDNLPPLFVGLSKQMGLAHRFVAGGPRGLYGAFSVAPERLVAAVHEACGDTARRP
jgi:hypothetical protein